MAEDGLVLNFTIGDGPLKPHVKFTGGRWRDRKRAQQTARRGLNGKAEPNDLDAGRPAKKRRLDDQSAALNGIKTSHLSSRGTLPDDDLDVGGRDHKAKRKDTKVGPARGSRQVVSSLFSFNPAQKTVFEEAAEEWEAPQPTNAPLELANFGSLSISSRLVEELAKMDISRPTAIQTKVVPHLLSSSGDAFVQAETGSGKTLSYLLPIVHRVLLLSGQGEGKKVHRDSGIFAIIVGPTRELVKQVHTVLEKMLRPFPWLVATALTGGESKKAEKARIRKGVNFLVATPGRLADHIDNTKALALATVRWLVLDEGDRLMELGFEDDLRKTISALKKVEVSNTMGDKGTTSLALLPERRVTVLCSATMKMNVQKLGEMSLADATYIAAEKTKDEQQDVQVHKAPAQLHQSYIVVPSKLRLVTLITYLKSVFSRRDSTMKLIIFMSCADSVDFHYEMMRDPNPAAVNGDKAQESDVVGKTVSRATYITSPASREVALHRMHGSLNQATRTATLKSFAACTLPSVLITTDVSSRGLDIPSVDMVVEYDPAFSFADHIHRVGRTARAGRAGSAVLFLLPGAEEGYVTLLKTSSSPIARSYDTILQQGLLSAMQFPMETTATLPTTGSFNDKAEALQLHLEQRVLQDSRLLELSRNGFKSQIRAYATHIRDERVHFDITELHLGHLAKSFGLREAPGGIGAGVDRKARKGGNKTTGKDASKDAGQGHSASLGSGRDIVQQKSRMLMNSAADEFNIG